MSCIKQIRLANTVFSVSSTMHMEVGGFLPQFETSDDADINIHVRYAEPGEETPDAHGYAKIEYDDGCFKVAIPQGCFPRLSVWQILAMLPIPKLLLERGTLVLHGSCIIWNGKGIVFSGPSGIGKSTQAALWNTLRGTAVINGDRLLVTIDKNGILVGSHYLCGTSGICTNQTVPLGAIILLEKGKCNQIKLPSPLSGFRQILAQLDYNIGQRDQMINVTALVEKLMANIPIIEYSCLKDESALIDLERYLYEKCCSQNDS